MVVITYYQATYGRFRTASDDSGFLRMVDRATATQLALAVQSVVEVGQFYGIEIGEFPARIAATALWMMDHIMNNRLSLQFGQTYAWSLIEESPHNPQRRRAGDRLADVLPPEECPYAFGFSPVARTTGTWPPNGQVRCVAALGGSGGTLDHVAVWFIRAYPGQRLRAPGDLVESATTRATGRRCSVANVGRIIV